MEELVKRLWECASGECFNCSQYTETTNASVCQKELMKQAADTIEELQADKAALNGTVTNLLEQIKDLGKPRWIPVTERLPEKDQTVLAYCAEDNFCYISRMHQSFEDYDVTHWIPLPKMPEEGET